MGKCHALALGGGGRVFGDVAAPRLGGASATRRWRGPRRWRGSSALRGRPTTGGRWSRIRRSTLVSITTPNRLHREMALAAIAAGKHVWCEKPLALTLGEAEEMAAAAEAARGDDDRRIQLPEEPGLRPCASGW